MEEKEYVKPKLKTPPPPELLIMDLDSLVYQAALVPQKTEYLAKVGGEVIKVFKSAKGYKRWLQQCKDDAEFLGIDPEYDTEEVEREARVTIGDVKDAINAFDVVVKSWVKASGCGEWTGYIGNDDSRANFRYAAATRFPYKGGRPVDKPHYFQQVREYAKRNPNIRISKPHLESDDQVVMLSQKHRHRCCIGYIDKDISNTQGCWLFNMNTMKAPVFSSKKVVGTLYEHKGKVTGTGILHLLHQCLVSDQVDNIRGIDGIGPKKSLAALEEFSGVDKRHTKDAINVVARMYKEAFGDAYKYTHIHTGEEVTVGWQDVLRENLILLHMLRWEGDDVEWVMEEILDES